MKLLKTSMIMSVAGLTTLSLITTPIVLYINEKQSFKKIENYTNYIKNVINDYDTNVNNEFIKGADVSTYADMIENFLFEKNIKKFDNEWYTYKDIASNQYYTWDDKLNKEVTLSEYINNNFYSYFNDNGDRIYANMFEILHLKGINSLRLRLWVDPYDKDGNSYGGGHNDSETTIFIINEAKKYGFNDFLLDFHYSDFWADPGKSLIPKSWINLKDNELIEMGYSYTYSVLKTIYEKTGINSLNIQFGNEINYGILKVYDPQSKMIKSKSYDTQCRFLKNSIIAAKEVSSIYNINITTNIHFAYPFNNFNKYYSNFKSVINLVDVIQISAYVGWGASFDKILNIFEYTQNIFPDKQIVLGEFCVPYTSTPSQYINDTYSKLFDYGTWTPDYQVFVLYQYMQFVSKVLPNYKTGLYWWEIGNQYIGRSSWASKSGIKYFEGYNYKEWKDVHNWSSSNCFDANGIALPSLDVFRFFERNIDKEKNNFFDPFQYFNIDIPKITEHNVFYKDIKFVFPKSFKKIPLNKIIYDNTNTNINLLDIDIDIYNNSNKDTLETNVINSIKLNFPSLMYSQVNFNNFIYNPSSKLGTIEIVAKEDSFYYKGSNTFKFKVHDSYYQNTIDLTNTIIQIDKKNNEWYKNIINILKLQQDWAFGKQIYDTLGVSGGANDNNDIWLWDENKYVNRNVEFFLLDNDKIRLHNNKVDYDVLNQHKIWIDNFAEYNSGEHEIFFAIKKGLNDIDWEYDIPSTYSQVGKESWKYVDLLVYKLKIEIN